MEKKVEKFKSDFSNIKSRVKLIKQKRRDIKKEIKDFKKEFMSVAEKARRLYVCGDKTMYTHFKGEHGYWTPTFNELDDMIDDLKRIMYINDDIQQDLINSIF